MTNSLKIISWNINSLRIRLHLLEKMAKEISPDIICLQETKVCDEDFPLLAVKKLGFKFIEFCGEKSYNGVAILSKIPLKNVSKIDILESNHKRHISATIETEIGDVIIHNFYVPAGGDIPDVKLNDKFLFKLNFLDWMIEYFLNKAGQDESIIMVGDINIAPLEHDVWSHKQLLNVVSHTPIEVEKMQLLQKTLNWIDSHRLFNDQDTKLYSWWSYRALDPFKSNRGRRLDHIWATPNLKNFIKFADIHKNFRVQNSPSDHVPIEIIIKK
jgi:exodeoxyribonuclease-3